MPQLNLGLVSVISSNVVLIQLYGLRMAITLIMFINITLKLHKHFYFVKKLNSIIIVSDVHFLRTSDTTTGKILQPSNISGG